MGLPSSLVIPQIGVDEEGSGKDMAMGASQRRLRIPVQFIGGVWEFKFGGQIPISDGTQAEIVVNRASVTDRNFLKMMEARDLHKVLEEGARLLVGLTVKPDSPPEKKLERLLQSYQDLFKVLGPPAELNYRYDPYFVEVQLAGPNDRQARILGSSRGGLWLITEGIEAVGLTSTTVKFPSEIPIEPVASVNHAFTKLSEIFESWRISHTGNIYKHVLHLERNGKWYPLEVLRNRALQKAEHLVAQALWSEFMAKMTGAESSPRK
jgi:hypothetical protein